MMESDEAPACPWCGATWTAAMLDALDRYSHGNACTCCVVLPGLGLDPAPLAKPQQDLCCESCGKPIYRAPASAASGGLH